MKPRTPEVTLEDDLSRSRLENPVSAQHPLVRLADRIDWDALSEPIGAYCEDAAVGQPLRPTRLMAGLLDRKHTYSLADEAVVERWVENPYRQLVCGEECFQRSRRSTQPG